MLNLRFNSLSTILCNLLKTSTNEKFHYLTSFRITYEIYKAIPTVGKSEDLSKLKNEFNLGSKDDMVDCEYITLATTGYPVANKFQPVDIFTMDTEQEICNRIYWSYKISSKASEDYVSITKETDRIPKFSLGAIWYCRNNPLVTIAASDYMVAPLD